MTDDRKDSFAAKPWQAKISRRRLLRNVPRRGRLLGSPRHPTAWRADGVPGVKLPFALTVTVPLAGFVCRATAVAPLSLRRTLPLTVPCPENELGATLKSCDGPDSQASAWATPAPVPTMTTVAPRAMASLEGLRGNKRLIGPNLRAEG